MFAIIALWELLSVCGLINTYLLPPFHRVAEELWEQIRGGRFLLQVMNSFLMILRGFLVSVVTSAVMVCLCSLSRIFKSLIRTLCTIFTPLPGVAIMPLIIMIFGIEERAMVILMLHSVLWPMVANLLGGIDSIPKVYTDFCRNIELGPVRTVFQVDLYAIMPCVIAGIRIGWGRAWRALISAEMIFGLIGNMGGIGYFIYTNRAYGNMERVMAGVLTVIILGVLIETVIFGMLEKQTIKKWGMTDG